MIQYYSKENAITGADKLWDFPMSVGRSWRVFAATWEIFDTGGATSYPYVEVVDPQSGVKYMYATYGAATTNLVGFMMASLNVPTASVVRSSNQTLWKLQLPDLWFNRAMVVNIGWQGGDGDAEGRSPVLWIQS